MRNVNDESSKDFYAHQQNLLLQAKLKNIHNSSAPVSSAGTDENDSKLNSPDLEKRTFSFKEGMRGGRGGAGERGGDLNSQCYRYRVDPYWCQIFISQFELVKRSQQGRGFPV